MANTEHGTGTTPPATHGEAKFPIVGIGASAGGLEALEQFLGHTPAGSGMAYVVIQHLDPTRKGFLPELLQRATAMQVTQAGERMPVQPDCVYVIPPNKDLILRHGNLHLADREEGLHLPIDTFFRSLAEELHGQAVGIVLSGMGSDGTQGLRAIREKGGLTLVQDPADARYDSMPKSAIGAGPVNAVARAMELPQRLIDLHRQPPPDDDQPKPELEPEQGNPTHRSNLEQILALLRTRTGRDFSPYKTATVYRRIERRMQVHKLKRIADYVHHLRENPQELDLLFKELLIGVTSFFRDPAAWAALEEQVLPALLAACSPGKALRAWVASCSTGEEAYSLAIAFREVVGHLKPAGHYTLQIFATDLDADAISRARQGRYPAGIAAHIPPARLARYFVKEGDSYRVAKEIREMLVFAPQDVIMDPPFTKLDILCCRNLLIYLDAACQQKLLSLFHYSLKPGGVLFLGSSETIGGYTGLFTPLVSKHRLYRREDNAIQVANVDFPNQLSQVSHTMSEPTKQVPAAANLQVLVEQVLLRRVTPPAVLVNGDGDIIYFSGRTGKYLEPPAGKANWNIHAMAREGLRTEVALALPKALREHKSLTRRSLRIGGDGVDSGSGDNCVDLTVLPLDEPEALRDMALLVFTDATPRAPAPAPHDRHGHAGRSAVELERTLLEAEEELRTVREELQAQREELRVSNEVLQSTNEELQSSNEELTSSQEEMQSLNEELQTLNMELQSKLDELASANSDMKNLLESTGLATVFLDGQLHVRRFTNMAKHVFKLIAGDIGRPLSDIVAELQYPEMEHDAREVLRSATPTEKQIPTHDGRWYAVKILPYRPVSNVNVVDGVVITLSEISAAKQLEAELRAGKVPDS